LITKIFSAETICLYIPTDAVSPESRTENGSNINDHINRKILRCGINVRKKGKYKNLI
jgi:hypothetical protein